ncbi:MAG: hypothetical protein GY708_21035 [Actinomycetia bacterium]|nr:hypothetical protein [Actinomycetes bacterium]
MKQRLKTLLDARPELADIQYLETSEPSQQGDVVNADRTGDAVWFRGTDSDLSIDVLCVPQVWDEAFSTDVVIQVARGRHGFSQDDCDARSSVILGAFLAVIGADPTLGLSGSWPDGILQADITVDGWQQGTGHTAEMVGFVSVIDVQLSGTATLQPT